MDDGYGPGFRQRPIWIIAVLLLVGGQAGLTAQLFGGGCNFTPLFDSRPVMDGRHPLHFYHGGLGASTFRERGASTCYDPAFQSGYPKTPIFDAGARSSEVVLYLAGEEKNAVAAYKIGLGILCLTVPLSFAVAARGFGLSPSGSCLAGLGGCWLWWTPAVRGLLDAGHTDLLVGGLATLVFLGGLARYAAVPAVVAMFQMVICSLIAWTFYPPFAVGLIPIIAVYYLVTAPRHGLAWHLGLIFVPVIGVGPNLWWLADWVRFSWLRQSGSDELSTFPCWPQFLGRPEDYAQVFGHDPILWAIEAVAVLGCVGMLAKRLRMPAIVLACAAVWAVFAARFGDLWPMARSLAQIQCRLMLPGLAIIASAYLLSMILRTAKIGPLLAFALSSLPAVVGWNADAFGIRQTPLGLGFTAEQSTFVEAIREKTSDDARILFEEPDTTRPGWNWTALLPQQCGRALMGGIDPDAGIEHLECGLRAEKLAGRALADWSHGELLAWCKRYNVGWVVCRTPVLTAWWGRVPFAREVGRYPADVEAKGKTADEYVLFELNRPRSFVLSGSAIIERADAGKIVLTNVVPDSSGEVVLSFHHQPELRAAPMVVELVPARDTLDPIPFMKLRLPGPVSRVTLTWEHP